MATSLMNHFDRLPDELVEKIFSSFDDQPIRTAKNHLCLSSNVLFFDYSIQQPLLRRNHRELIRLAQVCRRFYEIIKSTQFWERKCRYEHLLLPDQLLPADFVDYEKLYVYNPFHPSFNFIDENRWTKSRGGRSAIEPIPVGSDRLVDQFKRLTSCRVTSYTETTFYQNDVSLHNERNGSTQILQMRPVIEFSVCVAARWDCGSRCRVTLLFSDGHRWSKEQRFPQWNDAKWHRWTYRYAEYEQFPTSVSLHITGRDTQSWAGYYGFKFAQTRLCLLLRSNENQTNEENTTVIEAEIDTEPLPVLQSEQIRDTSISEDGQTNTSFDDEDY